MELIGREEAKVTQNQEKQEATAMTGLETG